MGEKKMRRDTSTGNVLEQMVLPALRQGGYTYKLHVNIGKRLSGRNHVVDVVAWNKNAKKAVLVSLKWQQVSGTAEQKVPFEVICLIKALRNSQGQYEKAYLVLGGGGWTLRDFYVRGGLNPYLAGSDDVKIVSLESFIALANKGEL
jgi:hypothetical protein